MAEYLGYEFIDAAEVICFDKEGNFDGAKTQKILSKRLASTERAVIPGFYGAMPDGKIKTFSRGGSDITGSIVAGAVHADLYENWTDVSGFLVADPRIIENPKEIDVITYRELRELSYMGLPCSMRTPFSRSVKKGSPSIYAIPTRGGQGHADRGSHLSEAPVYHHRDRGQERFCRGHSGESHDEFGSWILP